MSSRSIGPVSTSRWIMGESRSVGSHRKTSDVTRGSAMALSAASSNGADRVSVRP
ncbi:uncharacterized protein PHACADRAFT_253084 [Phanerochaete carnosa HHB-10118-sp]|uniref:Uncharacterized protein n=1 Tax=Phanerochaete carnosa (strain HHB-10118-sp) TaxID=650164 RepID=K5WHL9_PHACS|nr:uncharacterized protein PHACADRAFT_253084 [Phanerochaete carnosa HHB-10118-sp]EKM58619.1 hypothetical protein PHACADRAFT_253084 [Phanerochaete carnosa HHB-10118-sp]